MRYRILKSSDLIQYGDERWDFELGWTKMEDPHMERFSKEYRRAGENAWRFRRPSRLPPATSTTSAKEGSDQMSDYSDSVKQAFRDWNEHRAYLDNGRNYRVRSEPATPTHRPSGKIAPWNKEVKRLFANCGEFHVAAVQFKLREASR